MTLPRTLRNVWPTGLKPRYRYNEHHRVWMRSARTHGGFPLYLVTRYSTQWVRDGMPARLA